jgi:hypothetical protein
VYLLVLLAAIAGCDRSRQGTDIPSLNESPANVSPPDTATEDFVAEPPRGVNVLERSIRSRLNAAGFEDVANGGVADIVADVR